MDHSILLPVHRAAGARLSSGDPPEVLTYGDVPGEYGAARESCALFDQTDRGQLRIEGADASGFLHRILASDVRSMVPGEGQQSLLLSGKGKVLFAFDLFRDETGFWISTPPGTTPGLASALENYHFTEKLSIAETGQHAPMVVCGPHSDTLVRSVVVNLPGPREHSWVRGSFRETEVVVTRSGFAGLPGLRLDVGPHGAADLWNALRLAGARPSGLVVRDSLRVEACEALYGVDVDANVYPQEARLESAFSLTKGCYVGQEVVAKIDTYGGLNKRLVVLRVAHDDPVPRGARLYREEEGERRDLGVVTSWAYSFALDAGIALAYVKRRHQEPGTVFQLDETGQVATIIASPVRRASDEVKDPKP